MRHAVALTLSCFLLASSAHAQNATKPLAESLGARAEPLYRSGVSLFRGKQYDAALAQFRAAYKSEPDPRLLWNMAVCEKNLARYVRARELTEQYLREAKSSLTDAERTEATQFAASLGSLIATVDVKTTPSGATVFVDDEERGKSPVRLELDMGEHRFRVVSSGTKELVRLERLEGASERALDWTLEPLDSRLTVTSRRAYAISLNGQAMGSTPWSRIVAPGSYDIEITNPGYKPRRANVVVAPSETRTLDVELEPEASRSSKWPWIIGIGAGVVALGIGGYFLFRPSDERPAPTPSTLGIHVAQ